MLRFSKGYYSHSVHSNLTKLYVKYGNLIRGNSGFAAFGYLPTIYPIKNMAGGVFVKIGPYGGGYFKSLIYSFDPISTNRYEDIEYIAYHGDIKNIIYLKYQPRHFSKKKLWRFEMLTWKSIGKS